MRADVYVDGFNLYFGALRGRTRCKWLDIRLLCTKLFRDVDIGAIKYFTAEPSGPSEKRINHANYMRALSTDADTEIIYGKHKITSKNGRVVIPDYLKGERVKTRVREEKMTDVNIAIHLLYDAIARDNESAILISNDSDLAPAVKMVRQNVGQDVIVVRPVLNNANPKAAGSKDLEDVASRVKDIFRFGILKNSQLPAKLSDSDGYIEKPSHW